MSHFSKRIRLVNSLERVEYQARASGDPYTAFRLAVSRHEVIEELKAAYPGRYIKVRRPRWSAFFPAP